MSGSGQVGFWHNRSNGFFCFARGSDCRLLSGSTGSAGGSFAASFGGGLLNLRFDHTIILFATKSAGRETSRQILWVREPESSIETN